MPDDLPVYLPAHRNGCLIVIVITDTYDGENLPADLPSRPGRISYAIRVGGFELD